MDTTALRVTVAQAFLLRQIGLSYTCEFNGAQYVVSLRSKDGTLLSQGTDPSARDVLDVAIDGYVATYGEALPPPRPAIEATV